MANRAKRYADIGNNIKVLRKETGYTQKELAEKVNKSESAIRMWELGFSEPDIDTINLLSEVFHVNVGAITGKEAKEERRLPSNIFPIPKQKKLPILGSIACGEPILAVENVEGYASIDEDIDAQFCLRCQGDSMIDARIYDGDIVYIRQQPDVDNGEIAAVLIGDEATLKRVYKKKNTIILQPANKAYEPMVYTGSELDEIRILGKAVEFRSRVR